MLASSPYGQAADGWENTSIAAFLESAIVWATACNFGATQGIESSNPRQKFAQFLHRGKIYE
jgi:hypothetical protein